MQCYIFVTSFCHPAFLFLIFFSLIYFALSPGTSCSLLSLFFLNIYFVLFISSLDLQFGHHALFMYSCTVNLGLDNIKYKNLYWINIPVPQNKYLIIWSKCFHKRFKVLKLGNMYWKYIHLSNWDLDYMILKEITQTSISHIPNIYFRKENNKFKGPYL